MQDYGEIGDAGRVCSSGRSKGTIATRPGLLIRPTFHTSWKRKWGDEYKSPWRKRKEARGQNRLDYEDGKDTPAVRMMKKNNIKIGKANLEKWEPTETIEDEWVQRTYPKDTPGYVSTARGLMSKRGGYQYAYVPPPEPIKKKVKLQEL
jgi:hypothetical protein